MEHRCDCGRSHEEVELGIQYNLYQRINKDNVECLNEYEEGSGVTVFKPWEERLNHEKYVESDADEELLFNVPFTGNVKLKGLIVTGDPDGSYPTKVRLYVSQGIMYKNRPNMTFDDTSIEADQEFELSRDLDGTHEYPVSWHQELKVKQYISKSGVYKKQQQQQQQ
ncbi:PITH domain-containing protein GA19395 [Athalia rosae]|uniref:PITH domain-containing protein GA19395 n=1 Tax=Athalia rosae TaxID=37344 RepID=UPI002033CF22|nr:PITH domain-containing protein GA19395 [Athalia rosae]